MTANFHDDGTLPSIITLLKRSRRAGCREGHFLKIKYGIRSMGDGAEEGLDLFIAQTNSSTVMKDISIEQLGAGGGAEGIQDGRLK